MPSGFYPTPNLRNLGYLGFGVAAPHQEGRTSSHPDFGPRPFFTGAFAAQGTEGAKHRVQTPAALISPGNPSNAASQAALGRGFEQGRLWDAAGKCPVQREPFFVLLIFRGRFPSFTACLFYNRFDAGEDKLSHQGKTTNHLAALNRLFFFPPLRRKFPYQRLPSPCQGCQTSALGTQ